VAKAKKKAARAAGKGTRRKSAQSRKRSSATSRSRSAAIAKKKSPASPRKKSPAASKKTGMVIVASGDRPVHEVAGALRDAGFEVDQILHGINQITGRAAPALKKRLRTIRGVADVSDAHEDFDIGPPDAPVS